MAAGQQRATENDSERRRDQASQRTGGQVGNGDALMAVGEQLISGHDDGPRRW
jgi:hypothetical protein